MAATMNGGGEPHAPDERLSWVLEVVAGHFRGIKVDKMRKFTSAEETISTLISFLDSGEFNTVWFMDSAGSLSLTTTPQKKQRPGTSMLHFTKVGVSIVAKEKHRFTRELLVGDLRRDPLNHLEQLAQDVLLPLLSNPANQEGWSETVRKDVLENMTSFTAKLQIHAGLQRGQTCLPLPPGDRDSASQKDRVHLLEGCLITWTKQIKNVLKTDPEHALLSGQNPGPVTEIDFWDNKSDNLNSIFEQLQGPRIRTVLRFLDKSKSTYNSPFAKLCKEVFTARSEANDNKAFLAPLRPWVEKLEKAKEFGDIHKLFPPILHLVLLVWKNSNYYKTPARLVVLMRKVCNTMVAQSFEFLSGEKVFQLIEAEEPSKAVAMLRQLLKVCGTLKSTYFDYKAKANAECPQNPWRVQNAALFVRLDAFLERCHDILDLTQTIVQFEKLGSIEIGGTKGKTLTTSIQQIHADFQGGVEALRSVTYDVLDVDAKQFDDDFYEFRVKIKELERRLASVLTQGFEDCPTVVGRFKLLDSFDQLLERPIIQDELEKQHLSMLQAYGTDLVTVQASFTDHRTEPPISDNMPPIAGALWWCRGLLDRVRTPMEKLRKLNSAILDREEAKDIVKLYTSLVSSLAEYEHEQTEAWKETIESSSVSKLRLPLLKREKSTALLVVNFDPALVRLLREVKYFLLLELNVPDSALDIYKKAEQYRSQTGNLELIVQTYNKIQTSLLPVERPLLVSHLQRIDKILQLGLGTLTWKSHGIGSFITESQSAVKEADAVLTTMKDNFRSIETHLSTWAMQPMFERRPKPVSMKEFSELFEQKRKQRYTMINDGGKKIHVLIKETVKRLKVSAGLPDWKAYVDFVNNVVVTGLAEAVCVSMGHVAELLDLVLIEKEDRLPMLELDLGLIGKNVLFNPSVESTSKSNGVRDVLEKWINAFFGMASLFKRIDACEGTYVKEVSEDLRVQMLHALISEHMDETATKLEDFRAKYVEYEYLWTSDMGAIFESFLQTAYLDPPRDGGDIEAAAAESKAGGDGKVESPKPIVDDGTLILDLDKFEERIAHFQGVRSELADLPPTTNIGFLRVNSQPIKQALSTWVTKWIYLFTQFLHDRVITQLRSLQSFMADVTFGLEVDVEDHAFDKSALMEVMRHVRDVRKRINRTHEMFTPLRSMLTLLRQHGIIFEGEEIAGRSVVDFLENAPEMWDGVVNRAFKIKEVIQPLQVQNAEKIKDEIARFQEVVTSFRSKFKDRAPFAGTGAVLDAYTLLDEYHNSLEALESERARLAELEDLFELKTSKLRDTRSDLKTLKLGWDMMSLLEHTFGSWKPLLWDDIDTDELDAATRDLKKLVIKALPREMRTWEIYKQLEKRVNDMAVVIPLCNELHSPAMRERHWKQLMNVTHKHFDKGPEFCLEDVLKLELHRFQDEVSEIVEVANKELKIDMKLSQIESTWAGLELDYAQHKDSEVKVLKPPEEVVENLEEHQLQLQTMAGMGKFVAFFRERVVHWQRTLGNVESTLGIWLNVQRQWQSLESIFLGSADIRAQLPEDTKVFEGLDQSFKELMADAMYVPSVVKVCCVEGREQSLQEMWTSLERCQKALNEYLDAKKNIFPRFYFVSNVALLDILSNGNNPPLIMPHVGACFDGIRVLRLVEPEEASKAAPGDQGSPPPEGSVAAGASIVSATSSTGGRPPAILNTADAMVAKDGELVSFPAHFKMEGAVELWLNNVTEVMQDTLKNELDQALDEAANWELDKPRDLWLFSFPAQVVLLACAIFWTEEAEAALEELEGGQEDAVKSYLEVCNTRLEALIKLVQGKLSKADRTKIICLITMDVHGREIISALINQKIESNESFLWQSQLRCMWGEDTRDTDIKICDFATKYSYEYVGNVGRLVITPLTDRCYITLTMALRLMLGGAPAGPAGTGKTETTKDLARALGLPCYVFNCSDQMNYQTMADIFKGLSQTGAWGCFDEFNRIPIEVLSVVATQVKTILDAVRLFAEPLNREEQYQELPAGTPPTVVGEFEFMGVRCNLIPTTGFFITMNPGYAGRTELPENLKACFRSCAMIRPDLAPICENMLMAEGFVQAKPLSIKFVKLYELSSELLSPQPHYDWGLRNVKSVLRVAGTLKRAEPEVDEVPILMRALRDFNTPKMPSADLPIFLRLVSDLFPGLDLPPKFDETLKAKAMQICRERSLQKEDIFLAKVVNFQELLDVRHSVMLLGPAGCGKTTIWSTLQACHNIGAAKKVCVSEVLNPKSITSDELYGYMTLQKDWKDGALSIVMRNMCKCVAPYYEYQTAQWVVLDGDIDAVWIESMNTVMDDNKVLTLVSNERIPLTPAMRMVFEINSLKNATPATVSRAGILYINDTDIGWLPCVESWIQTRTHEVEVAHLPGLFNLYANAAFSLVKNSKLKPIIPVRPIAVVQMLCNLLDGLLAATPDDAKTPEVIEQLFNFAAVWAWGGALVSEKNSDDRATFSALWRGEFKGVSYPDVEGLTVYDYFFDISEGKMKPWSTQVEAFTPLVDQSFASIVVPTSDTVRLSYLMGMLVKYRRPVCFVGAAGTGKTTLVKEYLRNMGENMMSSVINMNYYTDSLALQKQLEQPIDKRSGKIYGPPSTKRLVYFIDDLNMPFVEEYGTQTPIALLRQHLDYGSWFDRVELGLKKEIQDVQFVAAMNHKSGSFTVNPRLQRHFATLSCIIPGEADLSTIYLSILDNHLERFSAGARDVAPSCVAAAVELHRIISSRFLPSATKFHYNFNMRDFASVFQGLTLAKPDFFQAPLDLVRLFLHECNRVFEDRLVNSKDIDNYRLILHDVSKKHFDEDVDMMHATPLIFTSFATPTMSDEGSYLPVKSVADLRRVLDTRLAEYNDTKPIMNLVLFEMAAEHVSRIARIIGNPRGNALLVGVGGSGKQSLSKLASFICNYDVFQISVTADYSVADLKENLKELYKKAGVKPAVPLVFLLTDSQIVDERFLVYVNDLLSSGYIPDLFTRDEYDAIFGALRGEAKLASVPDTAEALMEFFIGRVRSNLHMILCFSPVGDLFRIRARRFPGLINCTVIDWFHPWPRDALVSVASRFLADMDLSNDDIKENITHHMAEVHLSVTEASLRFLEVQRRYNYVTPKSFLELIDFYKSLLGEKRETLNSSIVRLDTGLATLQKTARDVAELQEDLKVTMVEVEEKKVATDQLLEQMGVQRGEAEAQQEVASVERIKADKAAADAAAIEADASTELAQAQPAMDAAGEAVNCLTKSALSELKNLAKPPSGVDKVTTCVLMMVKLEKKNFSWDQAKRMMANVDQFKKSLEVFDAKNIPQDVLDRVNPIVDDEDFTYDKYLKKSFAAANLANWVVNIVNYNRIYRNIKPLMDRLESAQTSKNEALGALASVEAQLQAVKNQLDTLQQTFMEATEEKSRVEAQASACLARLSLAQRLVNGLASENERWGSEVERMQQQMGTLVGDALLAAAFVSYIGAFTADLRLGLWKNIWFADIVGREIPITDGVQPLNVLASDASIAAWGNQGLPADPVSIENGAIITSCSRWPLIIDPQLQGITWLRNRYGGGSTVKASPASPANAAPGEAEGGNEGADILVGGQQLTVIQLSQDRWMSKVVHAISNGDVCIVENLGESIDAVLDPVLMRTVYKKGRQMFLRIAGEEVEYDANFRLFFQTKLANPHYKPEVAAQCTLINFIVTEKGLEDQLLAKVVQFEKSELEQQKQQLQQEFNSYKIQLIELEDMLLEKLANAPDDILSDVPLIEGLEATKAKSTEINFAVVKGKETEVVINLAREAYRPVAAEAAMLYFMMIQLCVVDHMYQYSLAAFTVFFMKSMVKAPPNEDEKLRIEALRSSLRLTIFTMVSRGLFESHKLIFLAQLTFNLLRKGIVSTGADGDFDVEALSFLLRAPRKFGEDNTIDWLPEVSWQMVCGLADVEGFSKLPADLVESAPRFKEWYNHVTPELEKMPLDWRELEKLPFRKLLAVRALRPDRMTVAVTNFVRSTLPNGTAYTECDSQFNSYQVLEQAFDDSTPATPIYFILSPGADIVADVDRLAKREGMEDGVNYHNISLGQGQDVVAMEKLESGHRQGWWVILNNVHLMPRWLLVLEKRLDEFALQGSHAQFRVFLSSDPSKSIPIGILDRCIKLINEPPAGLKANLKRAMCQFSKDEVDDLDSKTRGILFGLCHFHAVMLERKTFGTKGFNMQYPFSGQDLVACSTVLRNYMENAGGKIPWDDLRYVFGEIMYGGHIVNDFDRIMCNSYLSYFLCDQLLDEMELFPYLHDSKGPSFKAPSPTSYSKYLEYIDEKLPSDTPVAFGLHPNAEIGFRTELSNSLFCTILDLQPGDSGDSGEGQSVQHVAEAMLQDILDVYRDVNFDLEEISGLVDEVGPYQNVFLQECERMGVLLAEMVRSLMELESGFRGELTMSDAMERLMLSLFNDKVASSWAKLAFPSQRPLGSWLQNLTMRIQQLQDWLANPAECPHCTWISGLFNPQSFLTAVMQITAQDAGLELDKLVIQTEVLKRQANEVDAPSNTGAYITGLSIEGARWDISAAAIEYSKPKEMFCPMPVVNVRALLASKAERNSMFMCPVYKTQQRGPTYVFTANLRTKAPPAKWVLAGVVLVMDVV